MDNLLIANDYALGASLFDHSCEFCGGAGYSVGHRCYACPFCEQSYKFLTGHLPKMIPDVVLGKFTSAQCDTLSRGRWYG